jgi:hypothetical protein
MRRIRHRRSLALPLAVALVGALLTAFALAGAGSATGSASTPPVISKQSVAFHDGMRKLWEDHITWTRDVIISFELNVPNANFDLGSVLGGGSDPTVLPDLGAAVTRLLQNQVDIGDAIKPYYGSDNGDELTELLRQHILIAAAILTDLKKGDSAQFTTDNAAWYANAHDIAVFLNGLNPDNWPLDEMVSMMNAHLHATTDEVLARLTSDWSGDVTAYDNVHVQALDMADMLANGIIAQFPSAFHP